MVGCAVMHENVTLLIIHSCCSPKTGQIADFQKSARTPGQEPKKEDVSGETQTYGKRVRLTYLYNDKVHSRLNVYDVLTSAYDKYFKWIISIQYNTYLHVHQF